MKTELTNIMCLIAECTGHLKVIDKDFCEHKSAKNISKNVIEKLNKASDSLIKIICKENNKTYNEATDVTGVSDGKDS